MERIINFTQDISVKEIIKTLIQNNSIDYCRVRDNATHENITTLNLLSSQTDLLEKMLKYEEHIVY